MTQNEQTTGATRAEPRLPYPAFQIAKALVTSEQNADAATRQRALEKISKWQSVWQQIIAGENHPGSPTPLPDTPPWATLEVLTGGFASGHLLAAGPLLAHEKQWLEKFPNPAPGTERLILNQYFLSEAGLAELGAMLKTGGYTVQVPEEAALLVVAWLVEHDNLPAAQQVLDQIAPHFHLLRFYPVPAAQARHSSSKVHIQTIGSTITALKYLQPNVRILAQKEAVQIWAPFYDRMLALLLETRLGDSLCGHFSANWRARATSLLAEYSALRAVHRLCSKPEQRKYYFAQLRALLEQCLIAPETISANQRLQAGRIVQHTVAKRGLPDSATCREQRQRQQKDVAAPAHHQILPVLVQRLQCHPADQGLEQVGPVLQAVNREEGAQFQLEEGTPVPPSIQAIIARCLQATVPLLVEQGLIRSAEQLAQVLPQMTSDIRANGILDPVLRPLYAETYRAFRKRRSLLLLDLQRQVQIEELPWVRQIEIYRNPSMASVDVARQTLREICLLLLTVFPYTILPNKVLQELQALARSAGLPIALTEELAADIFMGEFSTKFLSALGDACKLLSGTLYARYYDIDYPQLATCGLPEPSQAEMDRKGTTGAGKFDLAWYCAVRAGVVLGNWQTAANGMILEQQQILTTHNLASLFLRLELQPLLQAELPAMARCCFGWICLRQQMKIVGWHGKLIMLKNTAYAWRQMVFFLALMPVAQQMEFFRWAEAELMQQVGMVQKRLGVALRGLQQAVAGHPKPASEADLPCFLGWSKGEHWMMKLDKENGA